VRIVFFLLLSSIALAQESHTTGSCSPIAPNNTGSITINCPGMPKEQGQKMIDILNRIWRDHLDPAAVMEKLDEIAFAQKQQTTAINELKARQGPWILEPATQRQMFNILKGMPGVPIIIDEWEESTRRFSQGLIEVFVNLNSVDKKWQVEQRGGMSWNAPPIGIGCVGPEEFSAAMVKIQAALQLITPDIRCVAVPASTLDLHDKGSVRIWVGERP
jgi:hypothetical protein